MMQFMQHALRLAYQGIGRTADNPTVGCVIVKDNVIIGAARTADGGRPHAETQALSMAGSRANGAEVYVTLEPCAHVGNTPSCAQALVTAGVKSVHIACLDPDPRTSGAGIEILKNAGIKVTHQTHMQAIDINAGFFSRILRKRPLITVKLAMSMDGKIALHDGSSKWITGKSARQYGHLLRAKSDAIMVGNATQQADNPKLDCRILGLEHFSPQKFVLSSDQNLQVLLQDMAGKGINRLMVEGGGKVIASLLQQNLVDELYLFTAPIIIGNDGIAGVADLSLHDLRQYEFTPIKHQPIGADQLSVYHSLQHQQWVQTLSCQL